MKLARPDVFHPRIVLTGRPPHVTNDSYDAGLVAALRRRGLHARWLSWDDPDVAGADLVILRAAGDYAERLTEFLGWTHRVANLLNPPAVVAWNVDRGYLADLADRGVATVSGHVVVPGEPVRLPRTGHVFVGPAIGTGARRCSAPAVATNYVTELHRTGRSAFVQVGHATETEETVLVFFGGRPSHAFIKQDGHLQQAEPDFELWEVGAAALAATAAQVGIDSSELLYARAHLAGARLLELQLVDPPLGWGLLDAGTRDLAQREFALCVQSAVRRLGLGPLSHRRP